MPVSGNPSREWGGIIERVEGRRAEGVAIANDWVSATHKLLPVDIVACLILKACHAVAAPDGLREDFSNFLQNSRGFAAGDSNISDETLNIHTALQLGADYVATQTAFTPSIIWR